MATASVDTPRWYTGPIRRCGLGRRPITGSGCIRCSARGRRAGRPTGRPSDRAGHLVSRRRKAALTSTVEGGCGSSTERVRAGVVDGRGPQAAEDHPDCEEPGPAAPGDGGDDVGSGPDRPRHHLVAAGSGAFSVPRAQLDASWELACKRLCKHRAVRAAGWVDHRLMQKQSGDLFGRRAVSDVMLRFQWVAVCPADRPVIGRGSEPLPRCASAGRGGGASRTRGGPRCHQWWGAVNRDRGRLSRPSTRSSRRSRKTAVRTPNHSSRAGSTATKMGGAGPVRPK